jgi:hypothetical protein
MGSTARRKSDPGTVIRTSANSYVFKLATASKKIRFLLTLSVHQSTDSSATASAVAPVKPSPLEIVARIVAERDARVRHCEPSRMA